MSITVPFYKTGPRVRPQPKPEFALMAAAQMDKEGKFAQQQPTDQTSALTSIQPSPQLG